jgi:hypothetical protein
MELDIRNLSPYDSATKELQLARESATAQKIKNEKAKVIDENARDSKNFIC